MGDVAEIIKTTYEIFSGGEDMPIVVEHPSLGMAYAIPPGTETTVAENYGPWHDVEMKQVFYEESSLLGSVLAEIQLILTWRYSEAQQYIIGAYLDKKVLALDPTASASISVRFEQPTYLDAAWEAYEIPFTVTVVFDPVGGNTTALFRGMMRADGTGSFLRE